MRCRASCSSCERLDCVDRGGDLWREVGDQAVVALPQALAWSWCEPELADARFPGGRAGSRVTSGPGAPYSAATPPSPGAPSASDDPDVLQRERLADRLDDGREHGVELQRGRERSTEPGDRGVGVVAVAVHQPVDEPLHAFAHRLEADCHDTGHDEREDEVAARMRVMAPTSPTTAT